MKIRIIMLVMICFVMQMLTFTTVSNAENTVTDYAVTGNGLLTIGGNNVSSRSVDFAKIDGKTLLYTIGSTDTIGSNTHVTGLSVVDVTDINNPTQLQNDSTVTSSSKSGLEIDTVNMRLYYTSGKTLYYFKLNADGTVDVDSKTTVDTPRTVDIMEIQEIDGYVFATAAGQGYIYDNDGENVAQMSTSGTHADGNRIAVRKISDNLYRIAMASNTREFDVFDFDSSTNTVTHKVDISMSAYWSSYHLGKLAYISDTAIVAVCGTSSKNGTYDTTIIDYSLTLADSSVVPSITELTDTTSRDEYLQLLALEDGVIMQWNDASTLYEYTSTGRKEITTYSGLNVTPSNYNLPYWDCAVIGDIDDANGALTAISARYGTFITNIKRSMVTETPYTDTRVVKEQDINIGEIYETTLTNIRIQSNVVANIGNKKVLFGKGNSTLYAYDVTNPEEIALINQVDGVTTNTSEMYVKDGYLIYVSNKKVCKCPIASDGALGTPVELATVSSEPVVGGVRLIDNYLFVGSKGVDVYDVSDLSVNSLDSKLSFGGTATTRSVTVEKISNLEYRAYELIPGSSTVTMKTYTIRIDALGGFSVSVSDEDFAPGITGSTSGTINVVAPRTVMINLDSGWGTAVVDVTQPSNPVIETYEQSSASSASNYRPIQISIDATKTVNVPKSGNTLEIVDYTNAQTPSELISQTLCGGDGASMLDGWLYATGSNYIKIVQIYEISEDDKPVIVPEVTYGAITFNVEEVSKTDLTASVTVSNTTSVPAPATVIIALYNSDNQLEKISFTSKNIDPGADNEPVSATILAKDVPENTSGMYLKGMLWKTFDSLEPLAGAVTTKE